MIAPRSNRDQASPQFSVIIPTLNEEDHITDCLEALDQLGADLEIIVVDGGSEDLTRSRVLRFPKAKWLQSKPGRAVQMNVGAREAMGEYLIFLHADTRLPKAAFHHIEQGLEDRSNVAGSFQLRFEPTSPILRLYGWMSGWNLPLATYGDQAFFLRKCLFDSVGGYRDYPICEDVEFQSRMRRLGSWKKIKDPVVTSARRFIKRGPVRQQLLNVFIVTSFYCGVRPERLHRLYYPGS